MAAGLNCGYEFNDEEQQNKSRWFAITPRTAINEKLDEHTFMAPNFLWILDLVVLVANEIPDDIRKSVLCMNEKQLEVLLPSVGGVLCCFLKSWRRGIYCRGDCHVVQRL
jgi:hypothetical protein